VNPGAEVRAVHHEPVPKAVAGGPEGSGKVLHSTAKEGFDRDSAHYWLPALPQVRDCFGAARKQETGDIS
jgi:hypothetical protein